MWLTIPKSAESDFVLTSSIKDGALFFFRKIFPRNIQIYFQMVAHISENHFVIGNESSSSAAPRGNHSLVDCFLRIRNDEIGIEYHLLSDSVTFRASSIWTIERKMARSKLSEANPALHTGIHRAVKFFSPWGSTGET